MKFSVNNTVKCGPRLGLLKEIEKHPNMSLETPMAMLYTRGGSIPHITNEVFKLVSHESQIIQIPLVSTYNFEDAMNDFQGDIADFVGMKECISCVTVQDPADYTQPGHHFQNCIPLWTRQGKVLINAKLYMNSIEAFKPDMYYLLSDSDTNIASSVKRTSNAVSNTISYFKECMERHEKSKVLKNSFVMGTIAGGYCFKSRKDCIDAVCSNDIVGGYLIDGLHNNGPEVELQKAEELKPIVKYVIEKLPQEKLRAIHGCWNPVTVLELVQLGIDLFDTSYCYILTERSCALTFSLDVEDKNDQYELNLRQQQYADDFQPILSGCTCLTCSKYSRGYIHHLVTVQELLGPLLLTIHNVHHYLKFFEKIRECIRNGTLSQLQEKITSQFNAYQEIITKKQTLVNVSKLKENNKDSDVSNQTPRTDNSSITEEDATEDSDAFDNDIIKETQNDTRTTVMETINKTEVKSIS
ncbi:hypothetical protein ILUMI_03350 [Ignelater luminosus]|uniref:Queuine tRNA-ribosyltransferase accessory subunit 2 n=1 Tax=Ignelater luminosus TaxID=2038154 RepID=A0A8K0GM93_IGNLU|nr:hypothetical protein ILUMI_03350 [Ignelater luminosus]